jgi:hypothetical protein
MRKSLKTPALRAYRCRLILTGLSLCLIAGAGNSGCRIKRTIKTRVPEKVQLAKTATLEELFSLLHKHDDIRCLSSRIDVTYYSGKKESGVIQEIRKQPGYIVIRRPNSTQLVVQNFVTKTKELELLSVEDDLSIWVSRGNKLYLGKNSARELTLEASSESPEFTIPIRGPHVFEAVFPQGIQVGAPGTLYSLEESSDSEAKYYVLAFYHEGLNRRIHTERKLWIERSSLSIARQQVFQEEGQLVSDIAYSDATLIDGYSLPLKMHIDRPLDGYALDLEFKSWRINPDLADNAFILKPPEGAQIIHLIDKKAY